LRAFAVDARHERLWCFLGHAPTIYCYTQKDNKHACPGMVHKRVLVLLVYELNQGTFFNGTR